MNSKKYAVGRISQDIINNTYWVEWRSKYEWYNKPSFVYSKRAALAGDGDFILSESGEYSSINTYEGCLKMYVSGISLRKLGLLQNTKDKSGLSNSSFIALQEGEAEKLQNVYALVAYSKTKCNFYFEGIIAQYDNLKLLIDMYGDYPIANKDVETSPITTATSVFI